MPKGKIRLWVSLVMTFVLISEVSVRDYDSYYKFNNKYVYKGNFATANSPVAKEVGQYYPNQAI